MSSSEEISDSTHVANAVLFTVSAIMFVITINATVLYYYLKPLQIINKRHPNSVLLMCIQTCLCIIFVGYLLPLFTQMRCCVDPFPHWNIVWTVFSSQTGPGVFFTTLYRCYMSFYDIQFSKALFIDEKWISLINSNAIQHNWFVRYRTTLGNWKYVAAFCALLCGLFGMTNAVLQSFNDTALIQRVLLTATGVVPLISVLIIFCKLPTYDDVLALRQEIKYISLLFTFSAIYYMGYVVLLSPESPSVIYAGHCANMVVITFAFVMVECYWVFFKFSLPMTIYSLMQSSLFNQLIIAQRIQSRNAQSLSANASNFSMQSLQSNRNRIGSSIKPETSHNDTSEHTIKSPKSGHNQRFAKIEQVLVSGDGCKLFCRHLLNEFSIENILFLLETQQLMDSIAMTEAGASQRIRGSTLNVATSHPASNDSVSLLNIAFHSSMPKSDIIFSGNNNRLQQCCLLFEKYIRNDGILCVNLSSRAHISLYSTFQYNGRNYVINNTIDNSMRVVDSAEAALENDWNIDTIVSVFDLARREIWTLMTDCFSRFKSTPEFIEWNKNRSDV